jgi:hypothetical protein
MEFQDETPGHKVILPDKQKPTDALISWKPWMKANSNR